jgi:hypothetical protein
MKNQNFVSALLLTASMFVTFSATAASVSYSENCEGDGGGDSGILYSNPKHNRNLEEGEYSFAGTEKHYGSTFLDEWKFTVAENSDVAISIFDVEVPVGGSLPDNFSASTKSGGHHGNSGMLLDNKFLTFSLFDNAGNLLGTAGEDGTLSVLNLLAGQWYTLTVSAKVNGMFGSAYYGTMEVVNPVPLGDSLPLFGSALLVLAVRNRKNLIGKFGRAA